MSSVEIYYRRSIGLPRILILPRRIWLRHKTATFWIYVADQHKRNTYYMRLAKEQRRRSVSPYTTYGYQTGYFVHKENTLMDIVIKQPYKLPYYFW